MARRFALLFIAVTAGVAAGCYCPRCPLDSLDGVTVTYGAPLTPEEKGVVASVLQLLTVEAGPESAEVRAVYAAMAEDLVIQGHFQPLPKTQVRGYVLMNDGRIALDRSWLRSAPLDSGYLANPRTWRLLPAVFAAGRRLATQGSWTESHNATSRLTGRLAARVERGEAAHVLPEGADPAHLAKFLRRGQMISR